MSTAEISSAMEAAASDDDLLPMSRNDLSKFSEKTSKKRPSLLGIFLMFLSGLLFTAAALFVKLLPRISAIEAAQVRSIVQFAIAVPFVLYFVEGSPLGPRDQLPWMLAFGTLGIAGVACSYYAVKYLPIGDATVLIFTSPVFTGIISRLVLKEPWGLWEAGASLLSIAGVVFIARPSFLFGRIDENSDGVVEQNSSHSYDAVHVDERLARHTGGVDLVAVGMALGAAVGMACAFVVARKTGQKVHYLILTMYYGGAGVVFTSIVSIATQDFVLPCSLRESVYMLTIGIFAFLAQVSVNKGLALERAVVGALVRNIDVVVAFIFQVTVFGDLVTGWSAVGTFFILSATLSITWKRYREELRKDREAITQKATCDTQTQ